jgi:CHAD domain-containing protein
MAHEDDLRSFHLCLDESAAEGIRRVAVGRTEAALEELDDADGGDLASAIHGARKDLKKLRATLRLVEGRLGKDLYKAEDRRYRDAGRLLSGSRDATVKLETLAALHDRFGESLIAGDAEQWEAALEEERDEIAAAALSESGGKIGAAREAIEVGRDRIGDWPLGGGSWKLVGPGLCQSYRQGRRAMAGVLADPEVDDIHEWRKRAKDLWYQLRLVREAWPALFGETADQVHELTDLLGEHHDLAVLAEDLDGRENVGSAEFLGSLIKLRQRELLNAALDLGKRIYAEKPKPFRRRLKAYWSAWRQAKPTG